MAALVWKAEPAPEVDVHWSVSCVEAERPRVWADEQLHASVTAKRLRTLVPTDCRKLFGVCSRRRRRRRFQKSDACGSSSRRVRLFRNDGLHLKDFE